MGCKKAVTAGIFAVVGALLGAGSAEAQAKPAAAGAPPAAAVSAVGAQRLADPMAKEDSEEVEARKHPMHWVGIGVKVGMAGTAASKMSLKAQGESLESSLNKRSGLLVSMPLNLGGDGAGWVFEPMLQTSDVNRAIPGQTDGEIAGYEKVSMLGVGGYMGPTFNFQVTDPLYLGFGFGLKGLYQMSNAFQYAGDVQARVPITGTYYVSKQLALVLETGFGYGASLYANKPQQRELDQDQVAADIQSGQSQDFSAADFVKFDPLFGTAFVWDASFGVRLP